MKNIAKRKHTLLFLLILIGFINIQCNNGEDDNNEPTCGKDTIVDSERFDNIVVNTYPITDAQIINNCLVISFSSSGCDGETWEYNLVDSGAVAESSPEQRYLKFELVNNEDCLAFINKTVSFNLQPLWIIGSNQIILNIEGYDLSITYNYN